MVDEDFDPISYSAGHDISFTQNPPIDYEGAIINEEDAFITRLAETAEGTQNSGNTLQELRDELNSYLWDIDQELPSVTDGRPTYRNQSSGY